MLGAIAPALVNPTPVLPGLFCISEKFVYQRKFRGNIRKFCYHWVKFQPISPLSEGLTMPQLPVRSLFAVLCVASLTACGQPEEATVAPPPPPPAPKAVATSFATLPAATQKLGKKPTAATTCPGDAPVKGMVSKERGNYIYTAQNPDYAKKQPVVCFKDAATAGKAGFKPLK